MVDVLLARELTEEALAWVTDPQVPFGLRVAIVEHWPPERTLPRAALISEFGKECATLWKSPAQVADSGLFAKPIAHRATRDVCLDEFRSLLPRDPSSLTTEEGFALGYASVATRWLFVDDPPWPKLSDAVAIARLRGMHAAGLSDPSRQLGPTNSLDCPTFQRLAGLVCSAERAPTCSPPEHRPLASLMECLANSPTPIATPTEQARFGGY